MAKIVGSLKDMGFAHITVSSSKGFSGAADSFKADNGREVAVCYNMEEVFVVEDADGLYGVDDLVDGVIKDKNFDVNYTGEIDGATIIAHIEDGEFVINEEQFNRLGINNFAITSEMERKLRELNKLSEMVELKFD